MYRCPPSRFSLHFLSILTPLGYYRGLLTQTQALFEFPESYSKFPVASYLHMLVYMHPCYSQSLTWPAKSSTISQERCPALGKNGQSLILSGSPGMAEGCWAQCVSVCVCVCVWVAQSHPTLWDSMECSLPGSSVHGILQARILEWVAIPFSRGSSWPRGWTWDSCIAGRFFTIWATREDPGHSVASSKGWVEPKGDATEGSQLPILPEAEGQVLLAGQSQLYNPMAATSAYTLWLSRLL